MIPLGTRVRVIATGESGKVVDIHPGRFPWHVVRLDQEVEIGTKYSKLTMRHLGFKERELAAESAGSVQQPALPL